MQIPSIPPPIVTNTLAQDVVAKAVPNVQAAPPLMQRAIDPSPKSEKFNQTRSNKDRAKGGGRNNSEGGDGEDKRGGSVNIRV
jgi:hypothetical protein